MFKNRMDAAKKFTLQLDEFKNNKNVIVLAIPRGALPMSAFIAHYLHAPLDIILTKKISAPFNSEFAIGAATPDDYFIDPSYDHADLADYIAEKKGAIQTLLQERAHTYRGSQKPLTLTNKIVLIIDDGIATGRTMLAAVQTVKKQNPKEIIVATPVISSEARNLIEQYATRVISIITPPHLEAIGQFYESFPQVSDTEAIATLQTYNIGELPS